MMMFQSASNNNAPVRLVWLEWMDGWMASLQSPWKALLKQAKTSLLVDWCGMLVVVNEQTNQQALPSGCASLLWQGEGKGGQWNTPNWTEQKWCSIALPVASWWARVTSHILLTTVKVKRHWGAHWLESVQQHEPRKTKGKWLVTCCRNHPSSLGHRSARKMSSVCFGFSTFIVDIFTEKNREKAFNFFTNSNQILCLFDWKSISKTNWQKITFFQMFLIWSQKGCWFSLGTITRRVGVALWCGWEWLKLECRSIWKPWHAKNAIRCQSQFVYNSSLYPSPTDGETVNELSRNGPKQKISKKMQILMENIGH